jgi:hypothetical protein
VIGTAICRRITATVVKNTIRFRRARVMNINPSMGEIYHFFLRLLHCFPILEMCYKLEGGNDVWGGGGVSF